jgi:hypothetical protein
VYDLGGKYIAFTHPRPLSPINPQPNCTLSRASQASMNDWRWRKNGQEEQGMSIIFEWNELSTFGSLFVDSAARMFSLSPPAHSFHRAAVEFQRIRIPSLKPPTSPLNA